MRENDLAPYACNWMLEEFGIGVRNVIYGQSLCDFIAVDKNLHVIEFEHKKDLYGIKYDFSKRLRKTTISKHERTISGNRVNRFYFLLPDWLCDEAYELIPKNYGILSYSEPLGNCVAFEFFAGASLLTKKKVSTNELFRLALKNSTRSYEHGYYSI